MATDTSVYPSGKTYSQKFTYVDSGYYNVMDYNLDGLKPGTISIQCQAKHDSTGLSATERLIFEIVDPGSDTLIGGTALATATAADSTAWQPVNLTYTSTSDRPLILRVRAKRGSGNAWYSIIGVQGASGSSRGGNRIYFF